MLCPRCGHTNNGYAAYCSQCNHALGATPTHRAASAPMAAAQSDYTELDYYTAFIGPHNQDYYLSRFQDFDRAGSAGMSWHWPAFFVTFFWFTYRKLWGHAIAYLLIGIAALPVVGIVGAILGKSMGSAAAVVLAIVYLLAMALIPPLYANAFYYRACRKRMDMLRRSPQRDERKKLERLFDQAGCSATGPIIGCAVMLVCAIPAIGIVAAISIPAYQDYTYRARIASAVQTGHLATQAVGLYYSSKGHLPDNLNETGFTPPAQQSARQVSHLDYNNQTGIIAVHFDPGMAQGIPADNNAPAAIVHVPQLAGNTLQWQCMHRNVKIKYVPQDCRQEWQENGSAGQGATG